MDRRILSNKWVITAAVVFVLYTVAGFFVVPAALKYGLENLLAGQLKTPISVAKVRINPYTFTLGIAQFNMQDTKGQPLIHFDQLMVNFETTSLFNWAWTFKDFRLTNPVAHISMLPGYRLNILEVIPESQTRASESSTTLPRFKFANFQLENGRIIFADRSDDTPFDIQIGPTDVQMKGLTSIKDENGRYSIAAKIEDGASINWQGSLSLNPIASQGKLTVRNMILSRPFLFVADYVNLEPPSGRVDLQSEYRFAYTGGQMELIVDNTDVQVLDVTATLANRDTPLFTFPRTSVKDLQFDLAERSVRIGALNISDGRMLAASDEKGVHDLQKIVRPLPGSTESEAAPVKSGEIRPWRVQLDSVTVDNLQIVQSVARFVQPASLQATVSDLGLQGSAEIGEATQLELKDIQGRFNQLAVRIGDDSEPWAAVETVEYANGAFDLQNRSISADSIRVDSGNGRIWLDPEKRINWLKAFALREKGTKDIVLETVKEVLQDDQVWTVGVKTVSVSDLGASLSDQSVDPAADFNLQNAAVELSNVSNQRQKPIQFDIKVDVGEGGRLQANGSVIPGKAAVDARVQASGVDLTAAQSYVSAFVPLTIDSGTADLQGRLKTLSADQRVNIAYDGGLNVSRLKVNETRTGRPFAGFSALDIPEMKLSLAPDSLQIKSINLKAPEGRIVIAEDRTINVVDIFKPQAPSKKNTSAQQTAQTPPVAFPLAVQRVRIENGRLDIADLSLDPQFGTRIRELNGVISELSSTKQSRAAIKMDGRIDEYGQFKMEGRLAPLQPTDFMNIDTVIDNLAMPSITPYTVKFAGRKIDSGKLSVDMNYRLNQQKLSGDHHIVIDNLELGPKIEGKGETNLPVDLAVALLKDPNDRINLSLSVSGRVDDPSFRFGQLMGQAFGQVLGNVAAAPFAAIGRLAGAKQDTRLNAVGFAPGRTRPPPPEMEKLTFIARGLQERPDLILQVQGLYHTGSDGRYLRTVAVQREIARRMQADIKASQDPVLFDTSDMAIQKVIEKMIAERFSPEVLEQLKSDFEKDSGAMTASTAGQAGQASGELHSRMFEYLVEQQPLDVSVLNRLAQERSDVLVKELTHDGRIDSARVVALEPDGTENLQDGLVRSKLSLTVAQ